MDDRVKAMKSVDGNTDVFAEAWGRKRLDRNLNFDQFVISNSLPFSQFPHELHRITLRHRRHIASVLALFKYSFAMCRRKRLGVDFRYQIALTSLVRSGVESRI